MHVRWFTLLLVLAYLHYAFLFETGQWFWDLAPYVFAVIVLCDACACAERFEEPPADAVAQYV